MKVKDTEIQALKSQMAGGKPAGGRKGRRETFFHGPGGLMPSPRNMFIKNSRVSNTGTALVSLCFTV